MGKKFAIFIPIMLLFAVLQTSLFPKMMILGVIPNLVLVLVCTIAYFLEAKTDCCLVWWAVYCWIF